MARFSLSLTRGSKSGKKKSGTDAPKVDLRSQLLRIRTTLRRRWQLTLVIGVVLAAGLYFMFIRPATADLSRINAEVTVAERRARNLREEFKALQSPEGAAAASDRFDRALALDDLLPVALSNQDILQAVSPLVEQAGLTLGESVASPDLAPGPADGLQFRSFTITVSGDFPKIVDFLKALSNARPLVSVYSATFSYVPASAVNNTPARVELTTELRFWSSNLRLIRDIKAELDSKGESTQAPAQGSTQTNTPATAPATTQPTAPTETTPLPASTESTTTTGSSPTPVAPATTQPAAAPTTQPTTQPTTPPTTAQQASITPGGFCSPEGATGTYRGVAYVCSKTDKSGKEYIDKQAHWREQV
jgi:hypothetical protein